MEIININKNNELFQNSILFDLEGTLVKTLYQDLPGYLFVLNKNTKYKLLELGIPFDVIENINETVYLRNKAFEWMENNLDDDDINTIKIKIENFMNEYDMEAVYKSKLYSDTYTILKILNKFNIELGIITNTSKKAADYVIDKYDIRKYFKVIVTRNDVKKMKPWPDMINLANKMMNKKAKWLIGDSNIDVMTAKNANIKSILINRNSNIPKYRADYYITSLNEILSIIFISQLPISKNF